MSKPREDWWSSAVRMVRNYPARKAEYEELHKQSMVPERSGMPSGSEVSRTTENIAARTMPPMKQAEYEAVKEAIAITKTMPDGGKRLELIKQMYWQGRKLNIGSVIYRLGIGEATGKRWHRSFVRLVGKCAGYMQ